MKKLNTLVAVHFPILGEGIKKILDEEPEITVKDIARSKDELVSLSLAKQHILILDINLPDLSAIEAIENIIEQNQELDILAIGEEEAPIEIKRIMQAGASGYICKTHQADELLAALKKISQGDIYLPDETIGMLYNQSEDTLTSTDLTERETEIISLICEEMTNREISKKLSISVRTVDAHRRNLLQKTGAKNTAGLVKYAIKHEIYNVW